MKINKKLILIVPLMILFSTLTYLATAELAPTPRCNGNICSDTEEAGQDITYYYTQHVNPNGKLKVRFDDGTISTSLPISFSIADLPPFNSYGKYNDSAGSYMLPDDQINPGNTTYKTEDKKGYFGDLDMVMWVGFSGLAEGEYNITLSITQLNTNLIIPLTIYVDNDAPLNDDESYSFISNVCGDVIDNDLNYDQDCADSNCAGKTGPQGQTCEITETICDDGYDNDGDNDVDCADQNCNGSAGDGGTCQYGTETLCGDGFDNDAEGGTDCLDLTNCWQNSDSCPSTETDCNNGEDDDYDSDYDSGYDALSNTGVDCKDYDCAGNINCPDNESTNAAWCFDGLDNDLDLYSGGAIDCADPDCLGVTNPANSNEVCYPQEFNITGGYNVCNNGQDDDGDGLTDCADPDCKQQFGSCGPCPAFENITYDSCADSSNNDYDSDKDCDDSDCIGEIGDLTNSGICQNTETSCDDGFDNDADSLVDCKDSDCNNKLGPKGQTCQSTETTCNDGYDNDGDGLIDCIDPNCQDGTNCADDLWNALSAGSCTSIPKWTGLTTFGSSGNLNGDQLSKLYINENHSMHFVGTGQYSSVTIFIGANTPDSENYPYDASSCTLTGTGTSNLNYVPDPSGKAGTIIGIGISETNPLNGFDIYLNCSTSGTPQVTSYSIQTQMADETGTPVDSEKEFFTTQLYENTAPTVSEIEAGTTKVKYGESISFRAIPSNDISGICQCSINLSGDVKNSADGNCIVSKTFTDDDSLSVTARAEDGADNTGSYFTPSQNISINVIPKQTSSLTITNKTKPFYNSSESVKISAQFKTADSDNFTGPNCQVILEDSTGSISYETVPMNGAGSNSITCSGSIPTPKTDEKYLVYINVTDNDLDSVISNKKVFYVCDDLSSSGTGWTCAKADFDQDGAAEGLFTSLYGNITSCDNCLDSYNPSQIDIDADGIGDFCDENVTQQYGVGDIPEIDTNQLVYSTLILIIIISSLIIIRRN